MVLHRYINPVDVCGAILAGGVKVKQIEAAREEVSSGRRENTCVSVEWLRRCFKYSSQCFLQMTEPPLTQTLWVVVFLLKCDFLWELQFSFAFQYTYVIKCYIK